LEQGQPAAADDQLAALEKADPNSLMTLSLKARVRKAQGKDGEAIKAVLDYLATKKPSLLQAAGLLEQLGATAGDAKDRYLKEAEAVYDRIAASWTEPERFVVLAEFLGRRGRVEDALERCERALSLNASPEFVLTTMVALARSAGGRRPTRSA